MNDKIYFPVYMLNTKSYEVASGSKYWNKNKTGTDRYETKEEAQSTCDRLNSRHDLKALNP